MQIYAENKGRRFTITKTDRDYLCTFTLPERIGRRSFRSLDKAKAQAAEFLSTDTPNWIEVQDNDNNN